MSDLPDIQLPPGVGSVSSALLAAGHDAVLVGGAVRDGFLGRASVDWDVVTDAEPSEVRRLAEGLEGIGAIYDVGERFGTIGLALGGGARLEVTRYRPDALSVASAEARFAIDSGHRDFTVNAMGVDIASGTLLDPHKGAADLRSRLLRAPVDPVARFAEDPLRVIRAARFVAELGFEVDGATEAALPSAAPFVARVAVERIREELTKLLVGAHAPRGLLLLRDSGALGVVLPEVAALDGVTQPTFHDLDVLAHTVQAVGLAPQTMVLRWAVLLHDVGKAPARTVEPDGRIRFFRHAQLGAEIAETICRRLRFSTADTRAIVHLVAEHMRLGDVNFQNPKSVDRAVRKLDLWVEGCDPPRRLVTAEDAVELTLADFGATAHREKTSLLSAQLHAALEESRDRGTRTTTTSPVSGRELMRELELEEGPQVGAAMSAIVDAIERGDIDDQDEDGALRIAREWIFSENAKPRRIHE